MRFRITQEAMPGNIFETDDVVELISFAFEMLNQREGCIDEMTWYELDKDTKWTMLPTKTRYKTRCTWCKTEIEDELFVGVIRNELQRNLIMHRKCFKQWVFRGRKIKVNLRK